MSIVHGTIHRDSKHFLLWGESDISSTRKAGRRSKATSHPFTIAADQIKDWLSNLVPHAHPEQQTLQLWLPTHDKRPQASPELRAMGVIGDDVPPPSKLSLWQIEGIALTIPDTLDLLLALTHQMDVGQSLHFWRAAALEALALVVQQQVLPALDRDGFHYQAFWQAMPEHPERLTELAGQMPPVCRAVAETPESVLSPYKLLGIFIGAVVDSTIREAASPLKLSSGRGAGAAWLSALTSKDAQLKLPTADSETLFKAWQTWSSQNDAAGNNAFRITFRLDAPDHDNQKWKLSYLLQATDDPSLVVDASQIWRGRTASYLQQHFDQPQERLLRGLAFAGRLFAPILESLRSAAPASTDFDTDLAYTFLQDAAPLLQASGFRVLLPRWWGGKKARLTARAKVSGGKQTSKSRLTLDTLMHYDYQVMLGGEPIEREDFMRLAALKQPLIQLRGQWVLLDAAQIEAGLKFFEHGSGELPLDEVLRLGLDSEGNTGVIPLENLRTNGWLKTLLTMLQQPEKIETLVPPEDLQAELRPYQQRGYSWLVFLRRYGLGACLADDMGLGKTLQTIALLLHIKNEQRATQPALVVCPTSVVGNWRHELQRFAPRLKSYTHQGIERISGEAFVSQLKGVDVVFTSYPLLARDRETLETIEWSTVILDEAQNIKNSATKQAQAARALKSEHRIALTGTPVENRLTELWSIFHFLNPGYLGSEQSFRRHFASPIEKLDDVAAAKRLRHLTTPFILRRLKTDPTVISDLPEKMEMKLYTTLTTEQGTLYEAVVKDVMERIEKADEEGDNMSRRGLVLSLLMQLKQICNHPAQYLKDGSPLDGRSGKLSRLTEMLEEIYAADDRALIFTQFAEMGGTPARSSADEVL